MSFCPVLCKLCEKPCIELECKNSGQFEETTCSCGCLASYSGELCETLECDKQPSICEVLFDQSKCVDEFVSDFCKNFK